MTTTDAAQADGACVIAFVRCAKCGAPFAPKRKDQTYCGRACQRNGSRGSRKASASPSQRRANADDWGRLQDLNATYYGTKPAERLGLLKDWLDRARDGDTKLRRVLARPEFFAPERGEWRVFFRRCWAYPPVPKLADLFCRRLRGCRVWEWVNGSAPEPETGEVRAADPPPAYEVAA